MSGEVGHQRWRTYYNSGAIDVPAFGALEVTGMTLKSTMGGVEPVLTAKRPTSASLPGAAINSHLVVPIGCYGECTFDFPTWSLYDTDDTLTYGESVGTQADSFLLKQGNTGFTVIGGQTLGRVYVERVPSTSVTSKILFLPEQLLSNYVLPQDFRTGTAVGYEWSISATNHVSIDFSTSYSIKDYYGSIALPGQKLYCSFNTTLNAWTPLPFGQNAMQLARTYKTIPANSSVSGDDIWLLAGVPLTDIVEVSSMFNDEVRFHHAHSDTDIQGAAGNPVDIILQLFHMDGGCEFHVIGRACNPQQ